MLGKLMKYEWKNTWKVGVLVLCCLLLVTLFGGISLQAPVWRSLSTSASRYQVSLWDLMSIPMLLIYVLMLAGLYYAVFIYLAVHFYRTMYTDEGYLTHTLPAGKHQILISKIVNSGIWMIFVNLGICLSTLAMVVFITCALKPEDITWSMMWNNMSLVWDEIDELYRDIFGISLSGYIVQLIITVLAGPFYSMITIFGAISIGQLFAKRRVLMAVVGYIGIRVVNALLGSIVRNLIRLGMLRGDSGDEGIQYYMRSTMYSGFIVAVLMAALLYFASYYVTSRKLNLE